MADLLHFPGRPITDDTNDRKRALDLHTSCIVEAPAGSGKTGLLVQRFLKLLSHASVEQPEEVLAITFTRKATAELQERVLAELHAAHTSAPVRDDVFHRDTRTFAADALARSHQLNWDLLSQPQRLNIRSIDSVCAGIANALPLLSGSGGPHQPIDDASLLYRQAARRTLLQLGGPDRSLHTALNELLLHRDGNLGDTERLLAEMLATREQWGELVPLGADLDTDILEQQVRPRLEAALEAIVCTGLTRALNLMPPDLLDELTLLAAEIGMAPAWKDRPPALAICADKRLSPAAKADQLDHWLALVHLVLIGAGTWRQSVDRGNIGHEFDLKLYKPRILALISAIQAHPQSEPLRQALCDLRCLPPAAYPEDQWRIARALFRVLGHALVELKLLFAERAECDFTELSLNARFALENEFAREGETGRNEASAAALTSGSRLRHLLVDELQDTSAAQYTLLELLTRSWDGRSQTLFLVGDPKQSIYLFRQARVERFLRTMREERLGEISLVPLRLTANFRSQATLVHSFNDTFEQLFPSLDQAAPDEVPFVPADAKRDEKPGPALHWHTSVLGEHDPDPISTDDPTLDHRRHEAREVCRIITDYLSETCHPEASPKDLPLDPLPLPGAPSGVPSGRSLPAGVASVPLHGTDGNAPPKRIAILVRNRSHLQHIVAELNRANLPYRALDIDVLNDRAEVLDALALTRALLHPADRTAWLAVLHAPWCGLGLGDLLTLTGEGEAADPHASIATLIQTRRHLLSPEAQHLLARAWPVLETAVATLGRTPLALHVERTWRSLGGDSWLTPDRQTNVLRYLDLLDKTAAENNGRIHLDLLTTRLGKLYAEPRAGFPQIELLTIHNAKGLEWDMVLVPALERPPRISDPVLLDWLEHDIDGETTVLLAPLQPRGDEIDPLNRWLRTLRAQRERAEELRLVYVAATRAREQLHLFGAVARSTATGALLKPKPHTLLQACWPVAEQEFARLTPATTAATFNESSLEQEETYEPLALAASAEPAEPEQPPTLQRLPAGFNPTQRFAQTPRLDYPLASTLRNTRFDRPEGSFAARAFGNVVHRYLQLLTDHLEKNKTCHPEAQPKDLLLENTHSALKGTGSALKGTDSALKGTGFSPSVSMHENKGASAPEGAANHPAASNSFLTTLPTWLPRLTASLRSEGLAPNLAAAEAKRALTALNNTLTDPTGLWILSPHPEATSEQALSTPHGGLRADRTFLAGPAPGSAGDTNLWIIDFKTTEQGSRTDAAFEAAETQKYRPQLEAYANLRRTLPKGDLPIHLALYYPLIPKLITWLA